MLHRCLTVSPLFQKTYSDSHEVPKMASSVLSPFPANPGRVVRLGGLPLGLQRDSCRVQPTAFCVIKVAFSSLSADDLFMIGT
jgi:hypothetical protein